MKNSHRSLGIALISVALMLSATALRCIASVTDMDYSTGFYNSSIIAKIANITMVAAVLITLVSMFLKVEKIALNRAVSGPLAYISSGIMAASLLFVTVDVFGYISLHSGGSFIEAITAERSCIAAFLTAVLALCAAAFFVLSCVPLKIKNSIHGYLGMAAALFFGMYAAFLFFRQGGAIHQPQKIATEMAALAMATLMLEETRIFLGKERWSGYFPLGVITASLSAYAVFPALAVSIFKSKMIAYSWAEIIMLTAIFVFAACRTISAAVCATNAPKDISLATEEIESIPADDERQIADEENSGN